MMVSQNSLVSGNRHPNCPSHREAEIQAENMKEWIPACLRPPPLTLASSPWPTVRLHYHYHYHHCPQYRNFPTAPTN